MAPITAFKTVTHQYSDEWWTYTNLTNDGYSPTLCKTPGLTEYRHWETSALAWGQNELHYLHMIVHVDGLMGSQTGQTGPNHAQCLQSALPHHCWCCKFWQNLFEQGLACRKTETNTLKQSCRCMPSISWNPFVSIDAAQPIHHK